MQVTKESIEIACNLPTNGEQWFKKQFQYKRGH
jgi:hypothetical protein